MPLNLCTMSRRRARRVDRQPRRRATTTADRAARLLQDVRQRTLRLLLLEPVHADVLLADGWPVQPQVPSSSGRRPPCCADDHHKLTQVAAAKVNR
ncbi:hypothetical protein HU200_063909 [Digitaria exilis]|uniref:Uncharacterized protein n=1 Tax=Digitaria exilis TaxID=1010633 RepID=A0A835DYP9_9POAL|nr:hypothetical protein HU200_063909 [Digitaria exilis]